MSHQEQCIRCRYFDADKEECLLLNEKPSFDSLICDSFTENSPLAEEPPSEPSDSDNNKPVSGWLAFFCFVVGIGGIVGFIANMLGDLEQEYGGSIWLKATDVSLGIIGLLIAAYTIYAIFKRKSNAVFFAKAYVIMAFVTNLILLLFGLTDEGDYLSSTRKIIGSLTWSVIWYLYLTFSEQVNSRFPKNERKVVARDWIFALSMVYVPLFFFAIYQSTGDDAKVTFREIVNEMNAESLISGDFDSVAYDENANVFSYYILCEDDEVSTILSRNEDDIKTLTLESLQEDDTREFLEFFEENGTTLRYVYFTRFGGTVRTIDITSDELLKDVSANQLKESALNMVEKEAEEANSICPHSIDELVTWTSCTFDRQEACMTFSYKIQVNKRDLSESTIAKMKEENRKNIIDSFKGNDIYKTAGVKVVVEYWDKKNQLICSTTITPNEY